MSIWLKKSEKIISERKIFNLDLCAMQWWTDKDRYFVIFAKNKNCQCSSLHNRYVCPWILIMKYYVMYFEFWFMSSKMEILIRMKTKRFIVEMYCRRRYTTKSFVWPWNCNFKPKPFAKWLKVRLISCWFSSSLLQFGPVNWIHFWCGMESNLLHTASKVYPIHWTKL